MQIERLVPLARQLLTVHVGDTPDLWLWEHAERVMRLTQQIACIPELRGQTPDLTALAAAALFHDAGWTVEFGQSRIKPWQLLARPTSEIQRELGAALLQERGAHLLAVPSARLACEAIRNCNNRKTTLLEARILAEAEALDEVSTLYVFRQFRQYQAEGRPMEQLVASWQRQKEYHYWELRLGDGFRYDTTRGLARTRLQAVDAFLSALGRDLHSEDLRPFAPGIDALTPPTAS
jgi:HD superfamily phosphodiesterase